MSGQRLIARIGKAEEQGTGWFVRDHIVCTAFHVVGTCADGRWLHERLDETSYWIEGPGGLLPLQPLVCDAVADIAFLSCSTPGNGVLPLADLPRRNVSWLATGFPGFHKRQAFPLSGRVIALGATESSRAVQLLVDQQTNVAWGGVSGAAVLDDGRVTAVITNVTSGTSTAWAAPVSAVHRLVEATEIVEQLRSLLTRRPQDQERDSLLAQLAAPELGRLAQVADSIRGVGSDDAEVIGLRSGLQRLGRQPPQPVLDQQQLQEWKEQYGVVAVREGGRPLRPRPGRVFQDVFRAHAGFGGRRSLLERMDRFVWEEDRGYYFLTGPSGFGKSAFLARWVETLRRRGEAACFHFFTARVPESLKAEFALDQLCQQVLALHQVGGDLPRDRLALQDLFADLLRAPAPGGRPIVIVIDALDEALETLNPGPAIFPSALGNGVHVVLSARPVADVDWLRKLNLDAAGTKVTTLGQFERDDIAEVLGAAGLSIEAPVLDELLRITAGDPFYVADVVRAIVERQGDLTVLGTLPASHSQYLRNWWDEGVERIDQQSFVDLMGTLAALRAPLGLLELASISTDDRLEAGTIGVLLRKAGRYVDTDRLGYWLRHDRVRAFVSDTLADDMKTYRRRVSGFTQRWGEGTLTPTAREYARRFMVHHLLDEDRIDDAVQALDPPFIAARWREDGSYAPLLADLDALLDWAALHPEDHRGICRAPAFAAMRESARDMMRQLPAELYRGWIRLVDDRTRIRELLDALPTYRGEARQPFLAVSDELLRVASAGERGRADRTWATELLERTIGMLPLTRTSAWKFEAWSDLCRLLATRGLEPEHAHGVLRQGQIYLEQLAAEDRDLKATCLAALAAPAVQWDRTTSLALLKKAEQLAQGLSVEERAFVIACAYPAYHALNPERGRALAAEVLTDPTPREVTALSMDPFLALIEAGAAAGEPFATQAAREHATAYLADADRESRRLVPPALLFRVGLPDLAWQVLSGLADTETATTELAACLEAPPQHRDQVERLIRSLDPPVAEPAVARALLLCGEVQRAVAMINRLATDLNRPDAAEGTSLAALPELVEAALMAPPSGEREAALETLLKWVKRAEGHQAAELAARSALALARKGHVRARQIFELALRQSLSNLPEGDADGTRHLVAVGLSTAGNLVGAVSVAKGCKWLHHRVGALAAVVTIAPPGAEQTAIGRAIANELEEGESDSFLTDALAEAARAVETLAAAGSKEWRPIAECIDTGNSLSARVAMARLRRRQGRELAQAAADLVNIVVETDGARGWSDVRAVGALAADVARADSTARGPLDDLIAWVTAPHAQRLARIGNFLPVLAIFDSSRAAQLYEEAMDAAGPSQDSPSLGGLGDVAASNFIRMLNELTGRRYPWIDDFAHLVSGLAEAAAHMPEIPLKELFVRAWDRLCSSPTSQAEFTNACQTYCSAITLLPPGLSTLSQQVFERIIPGMRARLEPDDLTDLLRELLFELGATGHIGTARWLAEALPEEQRDSAISNIDNFSFFHTLKDSTALERALFERSDQKGIAALVIKSTRDGSIGDALTGLVAFLKDGRVRYELLDRTGFLVPLAMSRWGVEGSVLIIDSLEDFDRRLIAAAELIGRGEAN